MSLEHGLAHAHTDGATAYGLHHIALPNIHSRLHTAYGWQLRSGLGQGITCILTLPLLPTDEFDRPHVLL